MQRYLWRLFLDQARRPTPLARDAVDRLQPQNWYRDAFIQGAVQVYAERGERYVLLRSTDEDRSLQTLHDTPFKGLLQELCVDEAGMQHQAHRDQGAFELAIVRWERREFHDCIRDAERDCVSSVAIIWGILVAQFLFFSPANDPPLRPAR